MASIHFQNGTIIPASWLNDVNDAVYTTVPALVAEDAPVTVSQLPLTSSVLPGNRRFVIDATVTTFASIVVGGGSNSVPVYSDGTNWRIG